MECFGIVGIGHVDGGAQRGELGGLGPAPIALAGELLDLGFDCGQSVPTVCCEIDAESLAVADELTKFFLLSAALGGKPIVVASQRFQRGLQKVHTDLGEHRA